MSQKNSKKLKLAFYVLTQALRKNRMSVFIEYKGFQFDETYSLDLQGRITREEFQQSIRNINVPFRKERSSEIKMKIILLGKLQDERLNL